MLRALGDGHGEKAGSGLSMAAIASRPGKESGGQRRGVSKELWSLGPGVPAATRAFSLKPPVPFRRSQHPRPRVMQVGGWSL